jgi:topoisomerase-4 subunit A
VILSEKGWVRAAKGHDVDARELGYREGDRHLASAKGRTTQAVAFIDSTGRSYSTAAHTLPSARGNGEPLTGRFTLPSGARFEALAIGEASSKLVLATDFGYGFVTGFEALLANKKAGKQVISLDERAHVLAPGRGQRARPHRRRHQRGALLMFSVADLPELDKGGKGNKLIEIPKAKLADGERVVGIAVVAEGSGEVTMYAGQRKLTLRWNDLVEYGGSRAARGSLLPRGLQRVERIETTG